MPYWNVFSLLHSRRIAGFASPNPIPLSEVECALRLHRVPEEMWVDYVEIIVALDNKWLDQVRRESDNKPKPPAAQVKS